MSSRVLTSALVCFLLASTFGSSKIITQRWVISEKTIAPDGVAKTVPVVNGQYPGPTLRGKVDDFVVITVKNNLKEPTTIHWHGIKQKGTVWSDGVGGITQCEIQPGGKFKYSFLLDAPGTLWWHSHTRFQKSSMQGAIIISGDQEKVGRHKERLLILNDWFHRSGDEQIAGITAPVEEFIPIGTPESLHINGKGDFNCSKTEMECDPNSPDKGPAIIDVKPGRTYRLRVIGSSSGAFMNLGIDDHEMKVVEADTTLLKPFQTKFLDVATGQSYSVLLKTKTRKQLARTANNNGLFWIQSNVRHELEGPRGLAILRYSLNSGEDKPRRKPPSFPGRMDTMWSLEHVRKFKSRKRVKLPKATRTLTILGTSNLKLDGTGGWALNNISNVLPEIPLLHQLNLGLKDEMAKWMSQPTIPLKYNYSQTAPEAGLSPFAETGTHVLPFKKDEVVDFVFQNVVHLGGYFDLHPWHLHLHNFWVLGYGNELETWDASMVSRYDTTTPVFRNTMVLFPGGWTAIRVKFDNPGMAFFHCHILAHLTTGMSMVAQIGEASDLPPPTHFSQMCENGLVGKV